jgi:hypothetical protein
MKMSDVNRHINEHFPEHRGRLMFSLTELSVLLGWHRHTTKRFLLKNNVSGYKPVGHTVYCLPEVIEAINSRRTV